VTDATRTVGRRALLEAAGLGAVAALALPTRLAGAQLSEAEQANVAIVGDFCAAWATRDMAKPLAFMSDDCVYRMTETTPPATGHQGVRDRLQSFVDASERVEFQILEAFAKGPIVVNHRIDRFVSAQPITWEGVGVFYVAGGRIKEWFDYTIRVTR
jgi:limonene-1,2-epoxide hydrolase